MRGQVELEKIKESVINGDEETARSVTELVLADGIDPITVVNTSLISAMKNVGEKWKNGEIYLPEVLLAVEAWNAAMGLVEPQLTTEEKSEIKRGVVVIGTVKGDIHDIGKSIVASLLKTSGFEVHDLGIDLKASAYVEGAEKVGADIIAVSALMTTTMPNQKDIVEYMQMTKTREHYFYMVGGGVVTQEWADEIGADGYGETGEDAVRLAVEFINSREGSGASSS